MASRKTGAFGVLLLIVFSIAGFILELAGWILLIALLLLLAAMCVPVRLNVRYEPEVTLSIRYLFLNFYPVGEKPPEKPRGIFLRALAAVGKFLLGVLYYIKTAVSAVFGWIKKGFAWIRSKIRRKPKKKPVKPAQPKNSKKKQSFFGSLREQRGFFGALKFFADAGKMLGGAAGRIYRGIRIDRLTLHVSISGDDAAETAINYGRICSAAFPALSYLLSSTRGYDPASPETKDIEIIPDFAGEGIKIFFIGEFTFFPILMVGNLLWAVIKFAVSQIKITSKLKKEKSGE